MSKILVDVADRVAVVTLNDPKVRNTISHEMNDELIAAVDELESRDDVGALVLTGAPPAFCAGGNLEDLKNATHKNDLKRIYAGFLRIAHSSLPTIAAINGPAVGAGLNYALACDVVLVARSARFESRFLQIGIHPGGGSTWRLRRITDHQTTMAMTLFGEVISAERAVEIGLAWRCIDDDALLDEARTMAARAASYPKDLVARTKATIMGLGGVTTSEGAVDHEIDAQAWSMEQPAFKELVTRLQQQISGKG